MGGAAKAVKKAVKKIKVEDAIKVAFNPVSAATSFGSKKVGVKADALIDPTTTLAANAGEKFIDQPKAAKAEGKRIAAQAAEQQRQTLAELEGRKNQEDAESNAAKTLERARARQRRRNQNKQRSTVLTDNLGGVGGSDNQGRKDLLGL